MLQSQLLARTVHLFPGAHILFLNSAADPFVAVAAQSIADGTLMLAEDNVAALQNALGTLEYAQRERALSCQVQHVAFHEYTLRQPPATMDIAVMDMLYQPGNVWLHYGLALASYALKLGGSLYVVGAKDRGVLTIAKRMQERFGNVETLEMHKGVRVVHSKQPLHVNTQPQQIQQSRQSRQSQQSAPVSPPAPDSAELLNAVFAGGKLDDGTRLLIETLDREGIRATDDALDIGCGAGYLGLHIARSAPHGHVTMVDVSLAAVAIARREVAQSGLHNITALPSDGAQAVLAETFDLIVTNPPFHQGGIQTTDIAPRFIRESAHVLRPKGRFYLVANRFLKYEPVMRECFKEVKEVGGDARYKVLRGEKS